MGMGVDTVVKNNTEGILMISFFINRIFLKKIWITETTFLGSVWEVFYLIYLSPKVFYRATVEMALRSKIFVDSSGIP